MKRVYENSIVERTGRNFYLFDIKNWKQEGKHTLVTKNKRFTAVFKGEKWTISDLVTGKKSHEKSLTDCMKFAVYCCDLMEDY